MARKRYTAEDIIGHLRTIEIETGKGLAIVDACRKLGITEQTYYRCKKEYGGLRVDQAKRLKGLEQETGLFESAPAAPRSGLTPPQRADLFARAAYSRAGSIGLGPSSRCSRDAVAARGSDICPIIFSLA
jgi:hypothetical protein